MTWGWFDYIMQFMRWTDILAVRRIPNLFLLRLFRPIRGKLADYHPLLGPLPGQPLIKP